MITRAPTGIGKVGTATVRKTCCDAGIIPIIVNTLGEPLAVGRETRTVTPAIWAALLARDLGCVFPGCERPPAWCQAHSEALDRRRGNLAGEHRAAL